MSLVLRKDLGRKLTIEELDDNFQYLDNKTGVDTFTLSAHPTLTTEDIGKFVMSWTDLDLVDYLKNGGTFSDYTGSVNQARVAFISGTTSGQNGKWTIDFSASYGGQTWSQVSPWNTIMEISGNNFYYFQLIKYNMQFQESDPYLSTIIGSLTYKRGNNGYGTFSYTEDPDSLAQLLWWYSNNGFPLGTNDPSQGSYQSNYTADGTYGEAYPYYITVTDSVHFISATVSGSSVQFELDKSYQFNSIQYWNNYNAVADVNPVTPVSIPYLQNKVVGILKTLNNGISEISLLGDIITAKPTTGSFDTNYILSIPSTFDTWDSGSISGNCWFISGGNDMVGLLPYLQSKDFTLAAMELNSPVFVPITSGQVGDTITFQRTTFTLGH